MNTCKQCQTQFEVTDKDRQFYDEMGVTEPLYCPQCRLVRRLMERNARQLYWRKCDFSGKKIISQYHEDVPFPVYDQAIWWGDDWDAMEYGRDFDFDRPFFEQFADLKNSIPHFSVFIVGGTLENSDYTNCTGYIKNCYLISESDYNEDSYYSNRIYHSKNLVDCSNCYEGEYSYECIDCIKPNNLFFSQECQNCSDSWFLQNCLGCKNCLGCINLRHKEYMIFNKQYTKEEYEKMKAGFGLNHFEKIMELKKKAYQFFQTQPHKALQSENNQNVVGDHVYNSKNAELCFDCRDLEDCKYCVKVAGGVKSCMDYTSWGFKAERVYESAACGDNAYNLRFCSTCTTNNSDLTYCFQCTGSGNLFGCVGLKRKKYCILNKQYSKSEYEELVPKIIAHMRETGEWGEFFPIGLCPFGYNETIAMDHFPLTKSEALGKGYNWSDYEMPPTEVKKTIAANRLPDTIGEIPDDVLNWAITCEVAGKPFRLTAAELGFYRRMDFPVPHRRPDQRHRDRMSLRPPYRLWERICDSCKKEIRTTYAPDRPEIVYCEQCYLKEVY
ncbi:MAG: zinc-ribbon domain containing protein [Patescibacteria group bacterium]